jgi:hypothetical protein
MPSFEEQFYIENPGRWQAFKRDLRLLLWLGHKAWLWLGKGISVRRAYRRAQRDKQTIILEDQFSD